MQYYLFIDQIDVAIWESRENSSEIPLNCVLLINNCAVIFYNERKKLTCQRSCVSIDPNIPRARKLKKQMEVHTHTGSSIGSDVLSIRPIGKAGLSKPVTTFTPVKFAPEKFTCCKIIMKKEDKWFPVFYIKNRWPIMLHIGTRQ